VVEVPLVSFFNSLAFSAPPHPLHLPPPTSFCPSKMSSKPLTQDNVMSIAREKGFIAFTATAIPCFGLSYYLHLKHPIYSRRFAPSAKVGLPLMASMFMGSLYFELAMFDAHRNPENWDAETGDQKKVAAKPQKSIPAHHWVMNRIHDRPFYFATMMAVPLAGSIMYTRMKEPHLTFSQALLQTRVVSHHRLLFHLNTYSSVPPFLDGPIWCSGNCIDHRWCQSLR
jgi:hypothetical protein